MKQLSPVHRPMTLDSCLLTLVLSLLSLVPCTLLANDGVYFASGNFLVPVKETDITVQKEVLEITLGKDSFAYVTVDYTFYNNSNEKKVTSDTPPALIFHCTDDGLVPVYHSIAYYQALVSKGVPASLHIYPSGGHGFCGNTSYAFGEQWRGEVIQWLKSTILKNPK